MMNFRIFDRHPAFYLIMAMLIWGSSFAAMKRAVMVYDPIVITFARLLISALVLLPFWRRMGAVHYRRGDWKWLLLMALCEPVLYFVFESNALRLTSSAAAATIIALLPLTVALAAQWLLREVVTGRLYVGLLVSVAGVVLLTGMGNETELSPHPWLGNTLEFLAMLCAVGYTLVVRRLSAHYPALFLTAVQAVIGSALYLPLLPFATFTTAVDGTALLAVWYLGAVVSVLAYLCYNQALSVLPASRVAAYASLIPVLSVFFGWVLLGETLSWLQGGAVLLTLAGVVYSQSGTTDPQSPSPRGGVKPVPATLGPASE